MSSRVPWLTRHLTGVNLNTEKVYFYRLNKEKKRLDLDKAFDGAVDDFPGYKFLDVSYISL